MSHPRPYLSYRQLKLIEQSPEAYRAVYYEGKPNYTSRAMALGKEVADALEKDEDTGKIALDLVIAQMPKYEIRDRALHMTLKLGKEKIPLQIKPDSLKKDYSALIEYKTGNAPWTQKKVDADDQLTYYATGVYVLTKKIPSIDLYWAPTEVDMEDLDNPGGRIPFNSPQLTGQVIPFHTERKLKDVLKMMGRMQRAWKAIGEIADEML